MKREKTEFSARHYVKDLPDNNASGCKVINIGNKSFKALLSFSLEFRLGKIRLRYINFFMPN
jgi:hypothetical protein